MFINFLVALVLQQVDQKSSNGLAYLWVLSTNEFRLRGSDQLTFVAA